MGYRAFISADIGPNVELEKVWEELDRIDGGLKMVGLDKLHVTLKFLGDIEEELTGPVVGMMEEAAGGLAPFEMELKGMGAFPSTDYIRVVWIAVRSDGVLGKLSGALHEKGVALGFKREKGFKGHLTLARMRSARGKDQVRRIISENEETHFMTERVNNIKLMKSTLTRRGPIYETVAVVPLFEKDQE